MASSPTGPIPTGIVPSVPIYCSTETYRMPRHKHPFWFDLVNGGLSDWEPTPWWMFWRPAMRRLVVPPNYGKPLFEYQHPAFVAREILEKRFAQKN